MLSHQTITLPKSRLDKYFDAAHLPEELGGTSLHNHEQWMQQRVVSKYLILLDNFE